MSTHTSKAAIRLAFAAAAACSSLPVSGPAVAAETDAQAGTIEQVTVTARRREESLQDVPVAITALTADQLLEQNVRTLEDITAYAPNI
jgi:iron complex outermembrane receptor protein